MTALRNLSARPELVVGDSSRVIDPANTTIGRSGPLGRNRVVFALPLENGPKQLVAPTVLAGLADPQGNMIGVPGVRVSRMLAARWTEDTRRLSG